MAVTPLEYKLIVDTSSGLVSIEGITNGFVKTNQAAKDLKTTVLGTTEAMGQMANKTGLAGAVVVEMGRTISDANYGMTAMANNLQQLSTLFVTLIATSGGSKNALKLLLEAFKGPLGFIVIFQIAITLMEKFALKNKRAAGATSELKDEMKGLNDKYELLIELAELDLELAGDRTDEAKKLQKSLKSLLLDKIKEIVLLEEKYMAEMKLLDVEMRRLTVYEALIGAEKDWYIQTLAFFAAALVKTKEALLEPFGDPSVVGGITVDQAGAKATNKELAEQARLKENLLRLEKMRKEILKQILDLDKDETDDIADEMDKLSKSLIKTTTKGMTKRDQKTPIDLLIGTTKEQLENTKSNAMDGLADVYAAVEDFSFGMKEYLQAKEFAAQEDFYVKMDQLAWNSTDLLTARLDRELVIEQNATNEKNNQLRDRLRNENLSAEERKRIQLKISDNDEELRKRQEKIERKKFETMKAANIAGALIDTYAAGAAALKNTGGGIWGIAAMIATITAGLVQVAAIASQKFQTTASTAPTAGDLGSSGGNTINSQPPNFNIIGDTGINQLRDTILGVANRPIKTYVTGKDIRTMEELDRNIVRGSTIGG